MLWIREKDWDFSSRNICLVDFSASLIFISLPLLLQWLLERVEKLGLWESTNAKDLPQPNRWISMLSDEPCIDSELSAHPLLVSSPAAPAGCTCRLLALLFCIHQERHPCWQANLFPLCKVSPRAHFDYFLPPSFECGCACCHNYFTSVCTDSVLPLWNF